MTNTDEERGTIEERDGRAIVRLERRVNAPPAEVWTLLTDPEEVALWLAELVIEPQVGGTYILTFANTASVIQGEITRFEPPASLEYRWREGGANESLVHFALQPASAGGGTNLVLTHTLLCSAAEASQYAAGWHHHLELLVARLMGRTADWDWLRFNDLLAGYGGAGSDRPEA